MSLNLIALHVHTLDRRDVGRSRHIFQNRVKQFLNASVSVGRTAAYRNSGTLAGSFPQSSFQRLYGRLLSLQILHHQIVVKLADLLNQLAAVQFRVILHIIRNVNDRNILALIIIIDVGFHLKQVNDSLELIFLADGQLQTDGVLAKSCLDLLHRAVEIRTHNIHLVDECHTGYVVGVSLTPYILGLRLNAALCAEHAYSAVQHAERTLNLYGKVNVTWSINDVDPVLQSAFLRLTVLLQSPMAGSGSRSDRDSPLLLLLHPVHGGSTLMGIADFIVYTSIVQNTLGQCGLTRIDMGHDSDVPGPLQRIFSSSQL